MNNSCYKSITRLDINSTPFVQIYDFKEKQEWVKYCEDNMGELLSMGFELEKLTFKYSLLLPSKVVDKYHEFTIHCLSFVTMSYHFETSIIVENQDDLWKFYVELLNEFRKDLRIESIDDGLRKRISSKV